MTTLILSLPNFQHAINHCECLEHKLAGNILISHWTYYFHVNHDFPIWYNILWRYTVTFIHVAVTFISIQNTLHCTYIYRLHLTKTWRLDIRWLHYKARYQGPRLLCWILDINLLRKESNSYANYQLGYKIQILFLYKMLILKSFFFQVDWTKKNINYDNEFKKRIFLIFFTAMI